MLDLEQLSDKAQAFFDQYVISGSDDELFASGYLRGHVDLVIGGALVHSEELTFEQTIDSVTNSVNKAIKNGELAQEDISVVNRILNALITHLS